MKPQFASPEAWEQAERLMQPALIRMIDNLREFLETLDWQSRYQEVQDPIPGHQLLLEKGDHLYAVNIWDLCFQVCFTNYQPRPFIDNLPGNEEPLLVEIDLQLLQPNGEVDWAALDQKSLQCIQRLKEALD